MSEYSEQDLKYASEFRKDIHREALAIVRRTRPHITEVVDRHPVEDYFQEHWDYPGKWYTIVAIPRGCGSREALINGIVRDTLAADGQVMRREPGRQKPGKQLDARPSGYRELFAAEPEEAPKQEEDPIYALIAGYPDCAVEYCVVRQDGRYLGCESHRAALKTAWRTRFAADEDGEPRQGDPDLAEGKRIAVDELFSPEDRDGALNYRRAFLCPPHGNGYTGRDFARVNAALFPNGTDGLEAYTWTTDWSEYFDDGHEWWGALCLTVYDKSLGRFAVMMASATD